MASIPAIPETPDLQVHDAFAAYSAMLIAECARPELARNEYWVALRDTAFARFTLAFDA